MNIAEATNATRIHHQWFPDEIRVEEGLSADTIKLLENRGHKIASKIRWVLPNLSCELMVF